VSVLNRAQALRVSSALRRGSSLPVVVETAHGRFATKLRGAAQGVSALIAEVIAAELAELASLPVPERVIVELEPGVPSDDHNDELLELLARSTGENLGFRWLPAARDLSPSELEVISDGFAGTLLWIDGLTMNLDRTRRNPNLLSWHGQPWLIDHGASLTFQYDWSAISEDSPREPTDFSSHVFGSRLGALARVDAALAATFDRESLERAIAVVPRSWLLAAFPGENPERVRASYQAFLWKRLKPPRPFVQGVLNPAAKAF
jgi:hypothetical protein